MNSISNSAELSLRVSGLTLLGTNVMLPPPPLQPIATSRRGPAEQPRNQWFFDSLMNMQEVFLSASRCPIPLFSSSRFPPLLFFMMCSRGERPATPLRWVALNEEKKRGRKILPGTSPNEQINASVPQERREGEREKSYWDPEDQAKTLAQKQLPHALNRSLF